jgi:hypothetical protein
MTDGVNLQSPSSVIIAPSDLELVLGEDYAGQTFAPLSSWGVTHLASTNDAIRWLFFRQAPFPPPSAETINLWINLDLMNLDQDE